MIKHKVKNLLDFMIFFLPVGTLLIMFLGLQDNVGTDYQSYLNLADGTKGMGWIERRSEFLFVYLVLFVKQFNNPQLIFVFTAIIQVVFLMLITYEIKKMNYKLHYFFFLYFALSLVFFNQFNGIRQYTAIYIVIYGIFKLMDNKKITYIILVLVASLFHSSAIFCLGFVILKKILNKNISEKKVILIMIVLFISSFFDFISFYEKILAYTRYSNYIGSSYLKALTWQGIVTKIPKLFIVLYSVYLLNKSRIDEKARFLINISYIACAVMIMSFSASIMWRFYQYLDFFIIFPVLMLMHDKSQRTVSILISLSLFIMLIIKIIVIPRGEYLYNWIIF